MKDFQIHLQEQIAYDLQVQFGKGFDFAWLIHQEKLYFSRCPQNQPGPTSAVVKLIQFLFDEHVDFSFFILRNRIFTTSKLSPMCEGMVQLAAKRATGEIIAKTWDLLIAEEKIEVGPPDQHLLRSKHLIEVNWKHPQKIEDPIEADFYLQNLISQIPRGEILHDFNRPIAALICSADGELLSWSVNHNSKNKTLHAEVAAVQKYFHQWSKKLPVDCIVYTSLKPCRMCAGMITEMAEDPNRLQAIYFQDDPGPLARNTELEKRQRLLHYRLDDSGS
ncbi:MAG: Bd3614 family nucleic acid deaminase [Pseudobdellovibrionaceae bacterium]